MQPHVLVLYQHYRPPDCPANARIRSLLRHLQSHAHVTLVTSDAWREKRRTEHFSWFPDGIDTIEVGVDYKNKMSTAARIQSYSTFALKALWHAGHVSSPDLVYGISTPLSTAGAAAIAARWHDVPWIFELHDLWPAFPIQMGAVPFQWLERLLYRAERALYQNAAHVVTMSPDMTRYVQRTGLPDRRVTTVLPGSERDYLCSEAAPSPQQLRREYDLPDAPIVLYAGTFGRANDIPSLIEAAERCRNAPFSFVFVGRGFYEPHLRRLAARHSSVHLVPPQPQHHMGAWYELATLSLVPFLDRPVLATNSPAKFFDSLTMGTPVLVTNPGWTKTFVEDHECGWYVPASSPTHLANTLHSLMGSPQTLRAAGTRGHTVARDRFDRHKQLSVIPQIINRVLH